MKMMKTFEVLLVLAGVFLAEISANTCLYDVKEAHVCENNNIDEDLYNTINECFDVCNAMSKCVAFVRNKNNGMCSFKSVCNPVPAKEKENHLNAYLKSTGIYKLHPKYSCVNGEMTQVANINLKECTEKCAELPGCVGFYHQDDGGDKRCKFYNECNEREFKPGNLYINTLGQFQFMPQSDCLYNNIKFLKNQNSGTCKQACMRTDNCVAVVIERKNNGNCWLKRVCKHVIKNSQRDTYLVPDCIDHLQKVCTDNGGTCRSGTACSAGESNCGKCYTTGFVDGVCCCKGTGQQPADCASKGGKCTPVQLCKHKFRCGKCDGGEVCCNCKNEG